MSTNTSNRRVAPEAAGAWPIIGHLHLLGGGSIPHITLGAMADKYGPAFTVRLGVHRVLVVSSCEVAKECFTTFDSALSTRPKAIAIKLMCYNYALFGFSHYGPYWRELRKIAIQELLSNRRLEMLKHVRSSEIEISIKELYQKWMADEDKDPHPINSEINVSALMDMKKWFGDLMLYIILRTVVGKRYSGVDTSYDMEEKVKCQEAMREIFHLMGLSVISDAIPFLEGLDLQGYERAMKRMAKNIDSILEGWLEEHRQKRLSFASRDDKAKGGEQDFMDVMISIMEDSKLDDYDEHTVIKSTCLSDGANPINVYFVECTDNHTFRENNSLVDSLAWNALSLAYIDGPTEIELSNPKLKYLRISGKIILVSLKDLKLLVYANFNATTEAHLDQRKTSNFSNILGSLLGIQELHFGGFYIQPMHDWESASFPSALLLKGKNRLKSTYNKLRVVDISDALGTEIELFLLEFILANSPVLETMQISTATKDPNKLFTLSQELLQFKRASPQAKVLSLKGV
ncbi:demethylepipodophyllotoxin synthase-like [Telopea speciosissima]|uniref:demethylepipodophyllotoxin synthase-like n=1 Tax=Telopea speciosissima TaxID=54955 RepID=UPI001CC79E12|nr:demethylepipodophyllotoxin synthase-like [Telopea speciosissima]